MKTNFKRALILIGTFFIVNQLYSQSLTSAIEKALNGQEVKFVKVDGRHEFHIKPINLVKGKGATGTLSHHLTARPDDQISYKIELKKDGTTEATFKIRDGGVGRMVGIPGSMSDKGGKIIDGTWEASMETLINTISLYIE